MLSSERSMGVQGKTKRQFMRWEHAIRSNEHGNFAAKSSVCHKLPCVCEEIAIFFRIIFHGKHSLAIWVVNLMFLIWYYYCR